jgi:hypothetical protein
MPDREEVYTPGAEKPKFVGEDKAKVAELEETRSKTKFGTTAGKGLGALGRGGFVPPKQESGEDSATYGARVRKARTDYEAAQAQKKALAPEK